MKVMASLRIKRFRGVGKQRKTEERYFRCFARAKNGPRAKKRKEGGGGGEGRLSPHFSRAIARNRGHFAPVINYQRRLIFKMADKKSKIGKTCPLRGRCKLQVAGCRQLVLGCRLQVAGLILIIAKIKKLYSFPSATISCRVIESS